MGKRIDGITIEVFNDNEVTLEEVFNRINESIEENKEANREMSNRLNRIHLEQLLMSYDNGWIDREEFINKVESI